jgi:hypothetical protein
MAGIFFTCTCTCMHVCKWFYGVEVRYHQSDLPKVVSAYHITSYQKPRIPSQKRSQLQEGHPALCIVCKCIYLFLSPISPICLSHTLSLTLPYPILPIQANYTIHRTRNALSPCKNHSTTMQSLASRAARRKKKG